MIKINVDEGYAFDFLAILNVKSKRNRDILISYNECRDFLISQIGDELFSEIESSKEYKSLFDINELIFKTIDKLKSGDVEAAHVDNLNYERFIHKKKIQDKFFDKGQSEIKIGYEKEVK